MLKKFDVYGEKCNFRIAFGCRLRLDAMALTDFLMMRAIDNSDIYAARMLREQGWGQYRVSANAVTYQGGSPHGRR
jgi:hypothetical protein